MIKQPNLDLPPFLIELDKDFLFEHLLEHDEDFRRRFVDLFYFRYGHRRIGCSSIYQFKSWVWDTYLTQKPKYKKFYDTADKIIDPFISVDIEKGSKDREIRRSRIYGDFRNAAFGNTASANNAQSMGSATGTEGHQSTEVNRGQNAQSSSAKGASGSKSFGVDTENNLFSNTPQGEIDNVLELGNAKGETGKWNAGYATTVDQNKATHYKYGNEYTGNDSITKSDARAETGNLGSSATASQNFGQTNAQNYSADQNTSHSNNTQNTGTYHNQRKNGVRKGLEGFLNSEALIKYRESCISIDNLFLNEFEENFWRVL